jgi:hypothetical protein
MSGFDLVIPEAPIPDAQANMAARDVKREALTIGVFDNGKGNADHLLKAVMAGIKARLPDVRFITARKVVLGAIPTEVVDRFVAECNLVVTAIAD